LSLTIILTLTACILPAATPVALPQGICTTVELLRDAQKEFDAGRYAEALDIAIAIRPGENEQNVLQYSEYYPDWDDSKDWEANEFYQKDVFLIKLVEAFLKNKQAPKAIFAARNIGQNNSRDRTLAQIVMTQLKEATETVRAGNPGEVNILLDKALETASFLDDGGRSNVSEPMANAMYQAGRFFDAVRIVTTIPSHQTRNGLLLGWVRGDYDMPESAHGVIMDAFDDPKVKLQALLYLTCHNSIGGSAEKRLKWSDVIVETFNAVEKPGAEDFRVLACTARLYQDLGQSDKAKTVTDLVDLLVLDLTPAERLWVYQHQIMFFEGSLSYPFIAGHNPMPADLQEQLDSLIRRSFKTVMDSDNTEIINTWLVTLLNPRISKELYQEILAIHSSSDSTLTEDQKINLARQYSERFRRPELSRKEQFDGIKTLLLPLASDLYSNSPQDQWSYARERSVEDLSEVFAFLLYDGRVEDWIELIDMLDTPQFVSPFVFLLYNGGIEEWIELINMLGILQIFREDVLVATADRHFYQSRTIAGYFYRINYRRYDSNPAPDIFYSSSPSPVGIEDALLAYRPGTILDYTPSDVLPEIKGMERIEKLFIDRTTDDEKKAELCNLSQRYYFLGVDPSQLQSHWDHFFTRAQEETHAATRFRKYLTLFHFPVPQGWDFLPLLNEIKSMAQGTEETGIHIQRSIALLDISYQYASRSFWSAEEQAQLQQNIEEAIERLSCPVEKYQTRLALSSVLLHRTPPAGRLFPKTRVREEHLTLLLELARNVPSESPGDRLTAYWWVVNFAEHIVMSNFAIQVADEALAFENTVHIPDQGEPTRQVSLQVRQIRDAIGGIKVLKERAIRDQ